MRTEFFGSGILFATQTDFAPLKKNRTIKMILSVLPKIFLD